MDFSPRITIEMETASLKKRSGARQSTSIEMVTKSPISSSLETHHCERSNGMKILTAFWTMPFHVTKVHSTVGVIAVVSTMVFRASSKKTTSFERKRVALRNLTLRFGSCFSVCEQSKRNQSPTRFHSFASLRMWTPPFTATHVRNNLMKQGSNRNTLGTEFPVRLTEGQ